MLERERERTRERAVDKAERKRRTGRDREGRYWPMCGGVMVAIRGSVPFVSPRAPIHHRASNHHSAMYLYTSTVCAYMYIYIYGAVRSVYGPTDGYSTRAHPPPLTEARLGSRGTSARTRSTYIRERTITRTGICTRGESVSARIPTQRRDYDEPSGGPPGDQTEGH